MSDWTADKVQQLVEMWPQPHAFGEIARMLGVSRGALAGKARRMKLPARGDTLPGEAPIRRRPEGSGRKAAQPVEAKTPEPGLLLSKSVDILAEHRMRPPVQATPHKPPFVPTPRKCQWPLGEPGKPGFHLCEAPAIEGKPYCGEHCAKAYIKRER